MDSRARSLSGCSLMMLVLLVGGCPGDAPTATADTTDGTSSSTMVDPSSDPPTTSADSSDTGGTSGGSTDVGDTDSTGETEVIPVPPACEDASKQECDDRVKNCKEDQDHDGVAFGCDNAPDHTNPDQTDIDDDGIGDIRDLCPTVATDQLTADPDHDGVGNPCDTCSRLVSQYNENLPAVPLRMQVRNIPLQTDSDRDGIGDACDNCVRAPNCQGYGDGDGLTPFAVGMPIDPAAMDCQADVVADGVGDDCAGQMLPGAAGPVGLGDADDFDQDGLTNLEDVCPRQPVPGKACTDDGDCPVGAGCTASGRCNHTDRDGDGVGDICDTCQLVANPQQTIDGQAEVDDPDGDFIGAACEQHVACNDRVSPARFAFYDISVDGRCCVTTHDGAQLLTPDGEPVDIDGLERPPGVFELPPGCEEALAASEDGKAHEINACHVDAPADLWSYFCLLPAWDQDFDGVPDECDLCEYTWDPGQEHYIDQDDKEWPNYGKYCRGEYDPGDFDPANMCLPEF